MANVDNPHGFLFERRLSGSGAAILKEITIETNTTITANDALIRDANGYGTIALATSAAIIGVAAESVTGVAGVRPKIAFYPALPDMVFSGQCSGIGTKAIEGTSVDIEGGTGAMELNEDSTSKAVARIIELKQNSAYGANAEFLFVWEKSSFTGQD